MMSQNTESNHMIYKIQHLGKASFENLIKHTDNVGLFIAKPTSKHVNLNNSELISSFIISDSQSDIHQLLNSCHIITEPAKLCPLPLGIGIVRTPERVVYHNTLATIIRPMTEPFSYQYVIQTMKPGDYFYIYLQTIQQITIPAHYAQPERFADGKCVRFTLVSSNDEVADVLIHTLNSSNATFQARTLSSLPMSRPTIKQVLNNTILAHDECNLLSQTLDCLLTEFYSSDATAFMTPGQVHTLNKPDIILGYNNGYPVGLNFRNLNTNAAIIGGTGAGKTVVETSIVEQCKLADIPCFVIAPIKQDFSKRFPSATIYDLGNGNSSIPLRINPLECPNITRSAATELTENLSNLVLHSDEGVLKMIFQIVLTGQLAEISLSQTRSSTTLWDLTKAIHQYIEAGNYVDEVKKNLCQVVTNRLFKLYCQPEFSCENSTIDFYKIFEPGQITILELNDATPAMRKLLAFTVMSRLRQTILDKKTTDDHTHLVIVIDELHELLGPNLDDPLRMLLADSLNTGRGMGIGHIIADQNFSVTGELASIGCQSHFIMKTLDIEPASSLLGLNSIDPMIQHLRYSKEGEGILHIVGQRSIPVSAKELNPSENATKKPAQNISSIYCPFSICQIKCSTCVDTIRSIATNTVTAILFGQSDSSIKRYFKQVRKATQENNKNLCVKALKQLSAACIRKALNTDVASNFSDSDKELLSVCITNELLRQLKFL